MSESHKALFPILKTLFLIIKTMFEARCENRRGAENNVNLQTFDRKFYNAWNLKWKSCDATNCIPTHLLERTWDRAYPLADIMTEYNTFLQLRWWSVKMLYIAYYCDCLWPTTTGKQCKVTLLQWTNLIIRVYFKREKLKCVSFNSSIGSICSTGYF